MDHTSPIADTSLYEPLLGACFEVSTIPSLVAVNSASDAHECPAPSTNSPRIEMCEFGCKPTARMAADSSSRMWFGTTSIVWAEITANPLIQKHAASAHRVFIEPSSNPITLYQSCDIDG